MESNLVNNDPQIPINQPEVQSSGIDSSTQRISELSTALRVVKNKFFNHGKKLRIRIFLWSIICLIIIATCTYLSVHLLKESFPDKWSWQIGYLSVIRLTIAGSIFSLATFCFKLFKSYIHLNEHNSHSIVVIDSMANLVGAAKDEQQRNIIYGKLIDIIIHFENSGFLGRDDYFKSIGDIGIESLKKLIEKKD